MWQISLFLCCCLQSFEGPASDSDVCLYHSGFPIFHEGLVLMFDFFFTLLYSVLKLLIFPSPHFTDMKWWIFSVKWSTESNTCMSLFVFLFIFFCCLFGVTLYWLLKNPVGVCLSCISRMKYWSCCKRKTSDFNTFLSQEGCTKGTHLWKKKDEVGVPAPQQVLILYVQVWVREEASAVTPSSGVRQTPATCFMAEFLN